MPRPSLPSLRCTSAARSQVNFITLAREQQLAGKTAQFEALKPWLNGEIQHISQAETARQLGLNEGALKVAIHRLRRRFREVLKTEIGQTLSDRAQVDEELRYPLEALL